jgi:hypothetical protein
MDQTVQQVLLLVEAHCHTHIYGAMEQLLRALVVFLLALIQ